MLADIGIRGEDSHAPRIEKAQSSTQQMLMLLPGDCEVFSFQRE